MASSVQKLCPVALLLGRLLLWLLLASPPAQAFTTSVPIAAAGCDSCLQSAVYEPPCLSNSSHSEVDAHSWPRAGRYSPVIHLKGETVIGMGAR